jgi:hypothetical protein
MHGEGSSANNGAKQTPEYRAWRSMFQRCYDETCPAYKRYGGRGIKVCKRWRDSYLSFLADMGRKPSLSHTLERVDNDKGYESGNVVWATPKQQAQNTLNTARARKLTFRGITLRISQWADKLGMSAKVLHNRMSLGWAPARILTQPIRGRR